MMRPPTTSFTVTDIFAGAGGSSTGMIAVPGVEVVMAANHWQLAVDTHNANHQNTDHACVDLHLEDPAYFPRTTMLWASPECTKWSQANGKNLPAIEVGLFEDPDSDDAATRSRLLMFDVLRFVDHHRYDYVVVENVVDIAMQKKYATAWQEWRTRLRALGYRFRVVSLNSMHAQHGGLPAPQSRDRIYIVAWREDVPAPDIDAVMQPRASLRARDRCRSMASRPAVNHPARGTDRMARGSLHRAGGVMSRLMSVAMTEQQVRDRTKTVTRRANWWADKNGRRLLKRGDTLTLCPKVQGRNGAPLDRICDVEVTNIRQENLAAVGGPYTLSADGRHLTWTEVVAEGFPGMHPNEFMRRFFTEPQGIQPMDIVTRIAWRYPLPTDAAPGTQVIAYPQRRPDYTGEREPVLITRTATSPRMIGLSTWVVEVTGYSRPLALSRVDLAPVTA